MVTLRENDQPVPSAPTESGGVLVDADAAPVATAEPSPSLAAEPAPVLLESPHDLPAAPTESTGVLVDVETASASAAPSVVAAPVLLESPHDVPAAPTEGQAGAVLVEAPAPEEPPPPVPARTISAPPPAVRTLPRRPRLRASFHYDHADRINVELTLMDEKRDLIHRAQLLADPASALARIFEGLINVATKLALEAGVFGTRIERE